VAQTPFAYHGGKARLAARIAGLLPGHRHYVEPFAGGLSVLLAKPPAAFETVNDLDGAIVTWWRVLRDRPRELIRACALTPHARAELDGLAAGPLAVPGDDLETARRVWVAITQSRAGSTATTGWKRFLDPDATNLPMPDYLAAYVTRIPEAAARLRHVSLECRPALEVIAGYGRSPATLIYADPPYLGSERSKEGHPRYGAEMTSDADHAGLAAALRTCAAAVVVSGYHSALYDDLYAGWHRAELRGSRGHGPARATTEVLWSNRPLSHPATLWGAADPHGEERTA
jgi:DNA adenine methylase